MLCTSSTVIGDINYGYVRNQLYADKQESIPESALVLCAKIINTLRRISVKQGEEASFSNSFPMRRVRNTLIRFSGLQTKFRERRFYPTKEQGENTAIFVTPATLYLLFCKDYCTFYNNGEHFTSYSELKEDDQKRALFKNFFDWERIEGLLSLKGMVPRFSFMYSNQFNVSFLGNRGQQTVASSPTEAMREKKGGVSVIAPDDLKVLKAEVVTIAADIKKLKKQYTPLRKSLTKLEVQRMDLGNTFRNQEKKGLCWNAGLYEQLKEARRGCNQIYTELQDITNTVKVLQSQMYVLSKQIHQQHELPPGASIITLPKRLMEKLETEDLLFQGLDPGVVTSASISCVRSRSLFEDVNRFELLQQKRIVTENDDDCFTYALTAKKVNSAVLSVSHRFEREEDTRKGKELKKKDIQRKRVTRRIRTHQFHQKFASQKRRQAFDHHDINPHQCSLISFIGNWHRNAMYIRGHTQRSIKPLINRLDCVPSDKAIFVDEYKSTITCSSCFETTTKQIIRTKDNRIKRIKGAVTCFNTKCPRKILSRSTTINRDQNGAKNIALIGFSSIISEDGLTLPPFRRYNNSNKYACTQKKN